MEKQNVSERKIMPNAGGTDCGNLIRDLITKRSSIKGQITKFKNYLDKVSKQPTLTAIEYTELSLKLGRFEGLSIKFDDLQTQVELQNSENLDSELDERESIEQDIILCTAIAKGLVEAQNELKSFEQEKKRRESVFQDIQCSVDHNDIGIKLPQIEITKFDGSFFRWLEFHDTFVNLIHNNQRLSMIQKFHYLLSYLEGEAKRIVSNIEVSSANYLNAWQLLCDRYNNKRLLINYHLKSLHNIQPITRESENSLRFLVDHITKNLRALSNLGQPTEHWDTLIIFMLTSKIDNNTLIKWEEHRSNIDEIPTLEQFKSFLLDRAHVLEAIQRNKDVNHRVQQYVGGASSSKQNKMSNSFMSVAKDNNLVYLCIVCNQNHKIYDCPTFKLKTIEERFNLAAQYKLCTNCLRQGHPVSECRMGPCRLCKGRHNTLLHKDNTESKLRSSDPQECDSVVNFSKHFTGHVLLSTALVEVVNPLTKKVLKVRALLDSGSQSTFITKSLQQRLSLKITPIDVNIVGIGNCINNTVHEKCTVQLQSRDSINDFKLVFSCLVLDNLTGILPRSSIDPSTLNIPKNIDLADPNFNDPGVIDVLIGADIFWDVLCGEQRSLGEGNPRLQSSKFGWLIGGSIDSHNPSAKSRFNFKKSFIAQKSYKGNKPSNTSYTNSAVFSDRDYSKELEIDYLLSKFWELEELPQRHLLSETERACEIHFIKNTTRLTTGRFCVKLPLLDSPDCLGDSYTLAKKRLLNLEKRFRKNKDLKLQYVQFMKEYESLGHLSRSQVHLPNPSYFLCHHAVFKQSSETTKIRVVFDGSAPSSSGYSVNDLQMVGPNIQDSLFAILIRARQYKYLLTGDIEKMYRQIDVHTSDRNLQLVLWREDESLPMQTMQLNTVTYGTASASYLSTRCLWQIGEESENDLIKTVIQKDFYIDDLITGSNNKEELNFIQNTVCKELRKGCFNLRKFKTNLPSLFKDTSKLQKNLTLSESSNTLGLGWNPNNDTLHFPINAPPKNEIITKRFILSHSFKIFDPLGLLSPCIMQPKWMIQRLWEQKFDWDQQVSDEIREQWTTFSENLPLLSTLEIPRYILCDSSTTIELHCFSDASQIGYGACIYVRTTNDCGDITVHLLCSKSKVAPLKPTSIPRLELCAALLAVRLSKMVTESLRYSPNRILYWCDSSVVLGWLSNNPAKLKTFVANRIGEILEATDASSWRYVPTNDNPADLISRSVNPNQLLDTALWWHGPRFLLNSDVNWPNLKLQTENLPEIKTKIITLNACTYDSIIEFERFSKLNRLKRTLSYVKRFIHNIRNPKGKITGMLTIDELSDSYKHLCFMSQQQTFQHEYRILSTNKTLNSKCKILSLSPFVDDDNLIRVGGRIDTSIYSYDKKHPILLDSSHHLTKLIFENEHIRNLHAGPQLLLASVRDTIWPLNGRRLARRVVNNCVLCRRVQGKTLNPKMGDLPAQRTTPDFPFWSVGVDYAGPFLVLNRKGRGAKLTKCYLCIFVCLRYKCLHLEAVSDLTKDSFIMTLRRFISRRGRPAELFSDNGRNFVAASKELSLFLKNHNEFFAEFAIQEGFVFSFSPSNAAHFGGIWEAGVKSAKYHVKRVMGNSHLTYEEISTLFAQVESILNSRPLCPLSSSPDDCLYLSPGHFLIGRPLNALPAPVLEKKNENSLDRYSRLEQIRQHFWRRWQREYISELQLRTKWKQNCANLKIGDLVLLCEDSLPPLCWRVGRVTRLFPGPDNISRVADVTTTKGTYRRPLVRLCPLLPQDD